MERKLISLIVSLLLLFSLDHPVVSTAAQSGERDQSAQERDFLARHEHFGSGRELLLTRRVPFDPDELLREGWHEKLKSTLDAMPEMRQTRYETAPLTGAYLADTLYLPEKVE